MKRYSVGLFGGIALLELYNIHVIFTDCQNSKTKQKESI